MPSASRAASAASVAMGPRRKRWRLQPAPSIATMHDISTADPNATRRSVCSSWIAGHPPFFSSAAIARPCGPAKALGARRGTMNAIPGSGTSSPGSGAW